MNKLLLIAFFAACAIAQCPNDQRCLQCNGTSCNLCFQSYPNNLGICTTGTSVANCYSYVSNGVCSLCNDGYYLNNGVCTVTAVSNCARANTTTPATCVACKNAIVVENNVCTGSTKCADNNCSICSSAAVCLKCNTSYSLTSTGTCVAETVKNCAVLGATNTVCSSCKDGYYQTATACVATSTQTPSNAAILGAVSVLATLVFLFF